MIDFQKLRHEWKTATLAIATVAVGGWDAGVAAGYDLSPVIPEQYRPYAVPLIGLAFLCLRKWTNHNVANSK
jgi:hypothetical protein